MVVLLSWTLLMGVVRRIGVRVRGCAVGRRIRCGVVGRLHNRVVVRWVCRLGLGGWPMAWWGCRIRNRKALLHSCLVVVWQVTVRCRVQASLWGPLGVGVVRRVCLRIGGLGVGVGRLAIMGCRSTRCFRVACTGRRMAWWWVPRLVSRRVWWWVVLHRLRLSLFDVSFAHSPCGLSTIPFFRLAERPHLRRVPVHLQVVMSLGLSELFPLLIKLTSCPSVL